MRSTSTPTAREISGVEQDRLLAFLASVAARRARHASGSRATPTSARPTSTTSSSRRAARARSTAFLREQGFDRPERDLERASARRCRPVAGSGPGELAREPPGRAGARALSRHPAALPRLEPAERHRLRQPAAQQLRLRDPDQSRPDGGRAARSGARPRSRRRPTASTRPRAIVRYRTGKVVELEEERVEQLMATAVAPPPSSQAPSSASSSSRSSATPRPTP